MKHQILTLAIAALTATVLPACHEDDAPEVEVAQESPIKLSETGVEIGTAGRYYSVAVDAQGLNSQVRATTNARWIELEADTLRTSGKLLFYVQPNDEANSRDAVITLRLGDSQVTNTLKVHQRSQADDDANAVPGGKLTRQSRVGYGYNMLIDYIDPKSVTDQILDYQKLVEAEQQWGTIIAQEGRSQQQLSVRSAYSIEEMAAWMTEQVSTEVNFLFYNKKVEKFKKVSEYDKTQSSFGYSSLKKTVATRYIDEGKLESIIRSGKDVFTADFSRLYKQVNAQPTQKNIAELISKYGTHLVVYSDLGGRLDYMVNFRSEETSREAVEKYMEYKNGKKKSSEGYDFSHSVGSNGQLSYDIYGGSAEAVNALKGNKMTSDLYNQIDPSLLDAWLKSVNANEPDNISLVHCLMMPIWQLFTSQQARADIISTILAMIRTEGGELGSRLQALGLDNYYRFDITKDMEQWGTDVNTTLVKVGYFNNLPKVEICNEYVPEIRGDHRVTIYYPIYRQQTNIRRGFFPGDGENAPAEVMFDNEGGCYVRPIDGYKVGDRLNTVYYIDGAFYPNNMGIQMQQVKMQLKEHKIDFKQGHTYPVVKIGPGYWIRQNIKDEMQFGAPVDPKDPECVEYEMFEEVIDGTLYANVFYGNSLAYRKNYPGLFDAEVNELGQRTHWYVPRMSDIKALHRYVGNNAKALFPGQQSGFEAQFAGYSGEYDDLKNGKKVEMGMQYVGKYCFIVSKEELSNSSEALVLSSDYTLRRLGITKSYDNWYPVRAYRTSYYKYN